MPSKKYKELQQEIDGLKWDGDEIPYEDSFIKERQFSFLNLTYEFSSEIDWNYNSFGKLWTYNLNYFDFLNQKNIKKETGLELILDYNKKEKELKDGLESYPISLRGINWIKFVSRSGVNEKAINKILFGHYQVLLNNLEYHLMGNHLLENGFALLFGAYYFKDEQLYEKAKQILKAELNEQILDDGAHFELSPMYHQILLHRMLDCINLLEQNPWKNNKLLPFLKERAEIMLSWLDQITFENGNIPMVNDAAYGIAPDTQQLRKYAVSLGMEWKKIKLGTSGYRRFNHNGFEVFIDVGNIGPDYQPGHAHSDTFNFEMHIDQHPVIVDTGTSTYEKNALRQKERETAAHNTVRIGKREQTQVWGGFRVGKRAKILKLEEGDNRAKCSHNGYFPTIHQREFRLGDDGLIILDSIEGQRENAMAFFHFHPDISKIERGRDFVRFPEKSVEIGFEGSDNCIEKFDSDIAMGFNKRRKAIGIQVSFSQSLKTTIRKYQT